jgi:two-component system OmpR family response regulator
MGRVLVVEDDERLARLVARTLQGAGLAVVCATTGPDGLSAGLAGDFDLVVLDLMLPGMPGSEVLRQLLDQHPEQRVLILSAVPGVDPRVDCCPVVAACRTSVPT